MCSVVGKRFCALNLTCRIGVSSWELPEIENRHRVNHLCVQIAFCRCVAPSSDVCGGNCAIAVHVRKIAAVKYRSEKNNVNGLAVEVAMQLVN